MKLNAYSIYDSKAEAWSNPYYATNDVVAQRTFENAVKERGTNLNSHPTDFTLFRVGSFNDETAELLTEDHKNLGMAINYLEQQLQEAQ